MEQSLRRDEDVGLPCAKCTVKHLRAALARVLCRGNGTERSAVPAAVRIPLSKALVAYTEYREGYLRHFDYAVGCLVMAEDAATGCGMSDVSRDIREVRVSAEEAGEFDSMAFISLMDLGADLLYGHLAEAARESPDEFSGPIYAMLIKCDSYGNAELARDIISSIDEVERTIFRKGGDQHGVCEEGQVCRSEGR